MTALPLAASFVLCAACASLPRAPSPVHARQMVAGQSAIPAVDLIIVHGCPARDDGAPSTCNQRRVRAALRAFEEGLAPRVLFTGGPVLNRYAESRVMAKLARSWGLPAGAILTEEESRHTVTNLSVAKGIMKRLGLRTALQVSESLHLVWAKQLAQFYRMQTWLYPADMLPPYTAAYERAQNWDQYEPWKTQTGVYGRPLGADPGPVQSGARRIACIVVADSAARDGVLASLSSRPGLEVQVFDWSAGDRPETAAAELSLWVRAWTRGFNGPVDEVVVLQGDGAAPVGRLTAARVGQSRVPLRFEEVGEWL
jgi:uncharacterized SAM-binding protein YcdF (DUF218 family)